MTLGLLSLLALVLTALYFVMQLKPEDISN